MVAALACTSGSHLHLAPTTFLGGKAFRHLAAQAHLPMRKLVRSMPKKEWNFEP